MVKVASQNEVSLNDLLYKIQGDVQIGIGSIYAPKFVSGDFDTTSREGVSILEWTDWSNGIGLERMNDPRQNHQASWSECHLRHPGHLLLPPLTTDATAESASPKLSMGIGLGAVWSVDTGGSAEKATDGGVFSTDIALGSDSDGYSSMVTAKYGGTDYFIIGADTSNYHFSSNGTSFTGGGLQGDYLVDWDNRLWGLDAETGQLWYAFAPSATAGDHILDAILPTETDKAVGMIVFDDALGNPIIYVLTTTGLYAHDAANSRFVITRFTVPLHPVGSSPTPNFRHIIMAVWRGALYIPIGLTVFAFRTGANASITSIGPSDSNTVLPDDQGGNIRTVLSTHAGLIALVEGTLAATTTASKSSVLMYSEHGQTAGWEVLFNSALTDDGNFAAVAGTVGTAHRLWWADATPIKFQTLPTDLQNPKNIGGYKYSTTEAIHETPIFDVGPDVNGIALRLKVQLKDAAVGQPTVVGFDINETGSFTTFGTITTNGTTTYEFPNSSTPAGSAFRTIQFQLKLSTASDTLSPDVLGIALEYERKLPVRYQYSFVIDAREEHKRRTPKTMLENLETAVEASTKVEFNYKGGDTDFPQYVDVISVEAVEKSGFVDSGFWRVTVVDR